MKIYIHYFYTHVHMIYKLWLWDSLIFILIPNANAFVDNNKNYLALDILMFYISKIFCRHDNNFKISWILRISPNAPTLHIVIAFNGNSEKLMKKKCEEYSKDECHVISQNVLYMVYSFTHKIMFHYFLKQVSCGRFNF